MMSQTCGDDRIVYLAYGSNTDPLRMAGYIAGSPETSPYGAHRGSSDRTTVRFLGTAWVDGRFAFRGSSRRWGGGVAVAEPDHVNATLFTVRYEISRRQLVDLVSQENRDAKVEVDWERLARTGRCRVTEGMYDTLVACGADGDELLLSSSRPPAHNEPSPSYLAVVRRGLSRFLGRSESDRYLADAVERCHAAGADEV